MFFKDRRKPKNDEAARLGFRSPLFLAKLGFDLRDRYDDLLSEPLPDEFRRSLDRLNERPATS